jgi:serine/threonine protein kinase/WD40 repeat protein
LLQAHEAGENILSEDPRVQSTPRAAAEKPGDRIGHFKLLEQIGEGGCGVVYMAEQEEPVRRRVALKVLKLGMDTRRVVARFEAERQALALMDHPNIAKVFDAGTTQSGRPYFAMELVRGVKITDYCSCNNLTTSQRLELVMQTCRAIQHAHQKGIIHRDIKPSNVLVSVQDGVPVPKVIDFGIAKATEGRLTDHTLFTPFEQFLGTPAYMSPEQTQLRALDVDTRTDIYSLGILLYELLTGKTPFDAKELLSAGLEEMRRTIREKEPPRPSTRLTLELANAQSAPAAASPGPTGGSSEWRLRTRELIQMLRGDLDWIVMKCLEKDRARRYETANGLAMDLQRYLLSEPVTARPPSSLYRLRKLVRRNKITFAAGGAVFLALVLGTAGSTWEAIRAWRAERAQGRLRQEAESARAGETRQRAEAEAHLYDALLGEARAKQLSGRAGQRFESLEAVAKAALLHGSRELSDIAVGALALPDLRDQRAWQFPTRWAAENLCFDEPLELFAQRTASGISIRRLLDDKPVLNLSIEDVSDRADGIFLRRFSPRSRFLAASCMTRNGAPRCRVFDLTRGGALAFEVESAADPDFSPDGQTIAVATLDGTVTIKSADSGRDLKHLPAGTNTTMIRFSSDGSRLATLDAGSSAVRIWDLASGQVLTTLLASGPLTFLAWSHNGSSLAVGGESGDIELWDAESGRRQTFLKGHQRRIVQLAFSHDGYLLASGSWDHTLRLWDAVNGQQLLLYRTQNGELRFSPDDRTLACAVAGETARLLEVAQPTGYRRLSGASGYLGWRSSAFSPDGRLLAVGMPTGVAIWDLVVGKELGVLPNSECRGALFETNGGLSIVASTANGLFQWPLQLESTAAGSFLRVAPPKTLVAEATFRYLACDRTGRKLVASMRDALEPLVLDLANPTSPLKLRGHPGPGFIAIHPDGRWAVKGTWQGSGVQVYDTSSGQILTELPVRHTAFVAFSPDGLWLAAADMNELRLWKTGSWEALPQSIPGDRVSEINPVAFSPDSRLLAATHGSYNEIQIVKVPGCESVATLRAPTLAAITSITFSPDGGSLVALEWSGQLDLWDLRRTRLELQKLNLDWDIPPPASAPEVAMSAPVMLSLDVGPFSKEELATLIPPRPPRATSNLVDLTSHYNAPLTRPWCTPNEKNDLAALPPGVQHLGGVDFDVRGLIQLGPITPNTLAFPNQLLGISIGQACRRLHFLHAAINASSAPQGQSLGSYILHYSDGRQAELPIIQGKDLADWWSQPNEPDARFTVAWTGDNPAAHAARRTLRLFKTTWENPFPDVPVKQLDFVSDTTAAAHPFLLAITSEP